MDSNFAPIRKNRYRITSPFGPRSVQPVILGKTLILDFHQVVRIIPNSVTAEFGTIRAWGGFSSHPSQRTKL